MLKRKYFKHGSLKAHFFFFFSCMAPVLPFVLVIAVQLGIPISLQGSLSAFSLVFTIVGKPLVAALADVFPSRRKMLFIGTVSIMVASFSAIKFIPALRKPVEFEGVLFSDLVNTNSKTIVSKATVDAVSKVAQSNATEANRNFVSEQHPQRLLLLTQLNNSGIAAGTGCTFVCNPVRLCPWWDTDKKNIQQVNFRVFPAYEDNQMTNISLSEISPTHGNNGLSANNSVLTSSPLYQIEELKLPEKYLGSEVRIVCKERNGASASNENTTAAWKSWQFWLLAAFLLVGQMAFNTAVSITDAIAVDTVGDDGSYGFQRAWGTIGWGVMAPVSGLLVDWWSGSSLIKDYTPAFFLCFVAGSMDVLVSILCLKVPQIKEETKMLQTLKPLIKQPRFFIFCCFVVLNGCFDGVVVNYIFVMQEDMARGTSAMDNMKFLQGLTILVQSVVEAPFMFIYGWFKKRLGVEKVTTLVFFLYIFRLFGLYLVGQYGSVWATLLPELLNGPCYGLGYTAIVVYAAKITPAGISNTVQSVVNICYESFGYAISLFVGGFIYDLMGGPQLYLLASGVATLTFIGHIASLKLLPLPEENEDGVEGKSYHVEDVKMSSIEEAEALNNIS